MRSFHSILITGGAGFIGSTLVRKLLEREDLQRLVVLDLFANAASQQNLTGLDQDPRLRLIQGDINDRKRVSQILTEFSITGIFHLAADCDTEQSIVSSANCIHTNVIGSATLLEAARDTQAPVLMCSTSQVYGATPVHEKFSESTSLHPSSPYAASKASADLIALAAAKTFDQDVVISRCTHAYGSRQPRAKLFSQLIYHALRDEPLTIYGSGQQIRDWMHVDDCALGLIATFEKGGKGQVYHLGANSENTNLGIARRILKQLHKPESLITHVPDRPGHGARYALDVRRSLQTLAWKARTPFRAGFEQVVRELSAKLRVG